MEGLGESEGKAAIFASQKMSALCLGGVWCGGPSVGGGLGGSWVGALEAGAALQRELRGSVPGSRAAPGTGLEGCLSGLGLCCVEGTQLPASLREGAGVTGFCEWQSWWHSWPGAPHVLREQRGQGEAGRGWSCSRPAAPAGSGRCCLRQGRVRLELSAQQGQKKEFSALSLGVLQSKWNKSQAVALFVVSGLDQGSAWRGVSTSVSGRSRCQLHLIGLGRAAFWAPRGCPGPAGACDQPPEPW